MFGDIISDSYSMGIVSGYNYIGGTGLTTAEMQIQIAFTDTYWEFVDETENGTEDIWWIDEGNDYPRLWWETIN